MRTTAKVLTVGIAGLVLAALWTAPAAAGKKNYKVKVIADVPYNSAKDADADKHKADLYLPMKKEYPVLFFIHGGGWTQGSRKKFEKLGQTFAAQGIGVVAIGYRLSPQVKHPGHIEDVAQAFAWTYQNIGKYGGNKDQIFVSGHSAGGHLAALLGTDENYLKKYNLSLANIRGVIPISGVFVISAKQGKAFPTDEKSLKSASPIEHVTRNAPPYLILYAEKDAKFFHTMAKDFADKLKQAGVTASYGEVAGRTHGTIVSYIPNPNDIVTRQVLEFIGKHGGAK